MYVLAILFTKLSICLLYLRVFGVNTIFRRFVYSAMALCIVYHTASFGIFVAEVSTCDSVVSMNDQICLIAPRVILATSVLNVFTNLYVLLLPINPILALNISRGKRYGVFFIFLSGSV